jgi:hypothetical protein
VLAAIKELTELLDQVNGWKWWATERERAGQIRNLEEYWEEGVDVVHFVLNLLLVGGMNDEGLARSFALKQELNAERQRRGYSGDGAEFDRRHPDARGADDPPCSGPGYAHPPHGDCSGYAFDRT